MTGHHVALRLPLLSDFTAWREIRLRDQKYIEPFWVTSPLTWQERHTETEWVRECLHTRRAVRAGRLLGLAITIDDRFAGQCNIGAVNAAAKCAELGIWIDATFARYGLGSLAGSLALTFAFDQLGMRRIVAPICVDNLPAARAAERVGFEREATMQHFFDVGGHRKDHDLWAVNTTGPIGDQLLARCKAAAGTSPRAVDPLPATPSLVARRVDLPQSRQSSAAAVRYRLSLLKNLLSPLVTARRARQRQLVGVSMVADGHALCLDLARPSALRALRRTGAGVRVLTLPTESGTCLPDLRETLTDRWSPHRTTCILTTDGRPRAMLSLTELSVIHGNAFLSIAVSLAGEPDPALVASGLARFLELGHTHRQLHRIATAVDPADRYAADLLAAAGFSREGRLRGTAVVGQVRHDVDLWAVHDAVPGEPLPGCREGLRLPSTQER